MINAKQYSSDPGPGSRPGLPARFMSPREQPVPLTCGSALAHAPVAGMRIMLLWASVEVPGPALLAVSGGKKAGPPPATWGSLAGARVEVTTRQQPENLAGSGWMLGTAWFPAAAWLVRIREEPCEEHPGKEDANSGQDSTRKEPGGRRPDRTGCSP